MLPLNVNALAACVSIAEAATTKSREKVLKAEAAYDKIAAAIARLVARRTAFYARYATKSYPGADTPLSTIGQGLTRLERERRVANARRRAAYEELDENEAKLGKALCARDKARATTASDAGLCRSSAAPTSSLPKLTAPA
jgi:hypothetical protein